MKKPINVANRKRRMWAYIHLDGKNISLHPTKTDAKKWWAYMPRSYRRIVPVEVKLLRLPV